MARQNPPSIIDISIDETTMAVDRNYPIVFDSQDEDMVLIFHFTNLSDSWSTRPVRIVHIVLKDSIYSAHVPDDCVFKVPKNMVRKGDMRIILRGYKKKSLSKLDEDKPGIHFHGVPEMSEDYPDGYIEANNFDDEIFIYERHK